MSDDQTRRQVLKSAVAAGGAAGLAACLDTQGGETVDRPTGTDDLSALPERQFAWGEVVRHDEHGNEQLPRHQILLYLTLERDGRPTETDRKQVERAFASLNRAFEWSHEGVVWSVAYSPSYFDRYDEPLPESVDCPPPQSLSPFEQPTFDEQDLLVHLASDHAAAVLAAEETLRGNRDSANGVTFDASLDGVATVATETDRRTGFVGTGMPAERQSGLDGIPDGEPVPETSPLFMGFKAGFAQNQATENRVAIESGPFAGGTTKHVARLRQRLDDWYDEHDFDERVAEMFSPKHAERGWVDDSGENLGDGSRVEETLDDIRERATEAGRVGHAQKAARANRDADGNIRLLRRHFESTDNDVASLHFPSLQREMSEFETVRRAMNGVDFTEETPVIRQRVNNGILEYIFVTNRGNWLVPPLSKRALPRPR
ncbi:Tat pathway signal protein [Halobacteriales archaeon SW_8_65_20]|nr:MAG: Tat pathway signal protein [Halobacteriales archaeon SW_8_65_20]